MNITLRNRWLLGKLGFYPSGDEPMLVSMSVTRWIEVLKRKPWAKPRSYDPFR